MNTDELSAEWGGEIHSDMYNPEVHYQVVVNDDYDEPYYFKDFASAKKYTLANVKKQDNTIISPQGDTIEVEKNQSNKDLDWLFQYSMEKGGSTYAEGGIMADGRLELGSSNGVGGNKNKTYKLIKDDRDSDGEPYYEVVEHPSDLVMAQGDDFVEVNNMYKLFTGKQ